MDYILYFKPRCRHVEDGQKIPFQTLCVAWIRRTGWRKLGDGLPKYVANLVDRTCKLHIAALQIVSMRRTALETARMRPIILSQRLGWLGWLTGISKERGDVPRYCGRLIVDNIINPINSAMFVSRIRDTTWYTLVPCLHMGWNDKIFPPTPLTSKFDCIFFIILYGAVFVQTTTIANEGAD